MSKLPTARRDRASGTLSLRVSAGNPGPETDQALSGAKAHGIGDAGFGIGVDRPGDDQNVVAGLGTGPGDAGVNPVFAPMTTVTSLLKTMRTVLPRPSFPVQPPSPLSLRAMTTRITAESAPLSTRGDDARETDLHQRNLFTKARTGGWRHVHI